MKGLKKYTHQDRQRIIEKIIPLVQEKFGDNLIALAAQGSFARNDGADYSDLELIAFVDEMPSGLRAIGKIYEGLLVELEWTTRENYIEKTLEVTEMWYISGSDVLLPIINAPFINELNEYGTKNLKEKCLAEARHHWHEVQESTAKALNTIKAENRDGISLVVFDMLRHFLISLSFLNQTPCMTFASFVSEARNFSIKPHDFDFLLNLLVRGDFQNLPKLKTSIVTVFSQLEQIFEDLKIELYDAKLDLD